MRPASRKRRHNGIQPCRRSPGFF